MEKAMLRVTNHHDLSLHLLFPCIPCFKTPLFLPNDALQPITMTAERPGWLTHEANTYIALQKKPPKFSDTCVIMRTLATTPFCSSLVLSRRHMTVTNTSLCHCRTRHRYKPPPLHIHIHFFKRQKPAAS